MSLCQECPNQSLCSSLCQEAEIYAKQDDVSQHLKTIGLVMFGKSVWTDLEESEKNLALDNFFSSPRKVQVETLLKAGFTRKEICQTLEITRKRLRDIVFLSKTK